ncbi:helix-turn-helix domain-containing protein [Microbulbifer sp. TYP-18]|uniref:helix-turn-helix domain-containing protein n=1 Tax=Microbulbifer sp. TYP-18 TaxID=3230024 RepID=UPI0034C5BB9E
MGMNVSISVIKQARKSNNWTQQHLADICSLSLRTIQRIEKTGVCSQESLSSLSAALEVPKESLLIEKPEGSINREIPRYKVAIYILTITQLGSLLSLYFSRPVLSSEQLSIYTVVISAIYLGSLFLVAWEGLRKGGLKLPELA